MVRIWSSKIHKIAWILSWLFKNTKIAWIFRGKKSKRTKFRQKLIFFDQFIIFFHWRKIIILYLFHYFIFINFVIAWNISCSFFKEGWGVSMNEFIERSALKTRSSVFDFWTSPELKFDWMIILKTLKSFNW